MLQPAVMQELQQALTTLTAPQRQPAQVTVC